jgi:hypothetical protein
MQIMLSIYQCMLSAVLYAPSESKTSCTLQVKRLEIQTIYDVNRNKKTKDINRIAKQSGMVTWTRRIILDLIIEILMEILLTNISIINHVGAETLTTGLHWGLIVNQ